MPGSDFYAMEDHFKVARQRAREAKRLADGPQPIVVNVRGYSSLVKREQERRLAKEAAVGQALDLKLIGYVELPAKWPGLLRPIFDAPSWWRRKKDFQVKEVKGHLFLLSRWSDSYSPTGGAT